jgi:hypothetical protein
MAQKNLSPRNNHVGGGYYKIFKRKRGGSYLVTAPLIMKGGQA